VDTNLLVLLVIENFELFMKIELSSQWCGQGSVKGGTWSVFADKCLDKADLGVAGRQQHSQRA
jgi:hypothetical protein